MPVERSKKPTNLFSQPRNKPKKIILYSRLAYRITFKGTVIFLPTLAIRDSPVALESSTQEHLSIKGTSSNGFLMGTSKERHKPSLLPLETSERNSTPSTPWGRWGGRSEPKISFKLKRKNFNLTNHKFYYGHTTSSHWNY